jgi:hypothetical protein
MQWVSNGREMASQANIFHLIGEAHRRLLIAKSDLKELNT